jgi:hypothetical protein
MKINKIKANLDKIKFVLRTYAVFFLDNIDLPRPWHLSRVYDKCRGLYGKTTEPFLYSSVAKYNAERLCKR